MLKQIYLALSFLQKYILGTNDSVCNLEGGCAVTIYNVKSVERDVGQCIAMACKDLFDFNDETWFYIKRIVSVVMGIKMSV
jgi:hypothetical protein